MAEEHLYNVYLQSCGEHGSCYRVLATRAEILSGKASEPVAVAAGGAGGARRSHFRWEEAGRVRGEAGRGLVQGRYPWPDEGMLTVWLP